MTIFHLQSVVPRSPWPLLTALHMSGVAHSIILALTEHTWSLFWLYVVLFQAYPVLMWWRDLVRESTYQGHHNLQIQRSYKWAVFYFLLFEGFFFVGIFWTYLHYALSPSVWGGRCWPPYSVVSPSPWTIALINTFTLIWSGVVLTLSHKYLKAGSLSARWPLLATVLLGFFFISLQGYEYWVLPFSISTSCYGSIFFFGTGCHGLHVLLGAVFLTVNLVRMQLRHFSRTHHLSFLFSIWYWHFVDVIWILLYLIFYLWGRTLG